MSKLVDSFSVEVSFQVSYTAMSVSEFGLYHLIDTRPFGLLDNMGQNLSIMVWKINFGQKKTISAEILLTSTTICWYVGVTTKQSEKSECCSMMGSHHHTPSEDGYSHYYSNLTPGGGDHRHSPKDGTSSSSSNHSTINGFAGASAAYSPFGALTPEHPHHTTEPFGASLASAGISN